MDDDWEIANWGNTTTADETTDYDADGLLDWEEFVAGTEATNVLSLLKITTAAKAGGGGYLVTWDSVSGKQYTIRRGPDVDTTLTAIASNIAAIPPSNTFTDSTPPATEGVLYRIEVEQP